MNLFLITRRIKPTRFVISLTKGKMKPPQEVIDNCYRGYTPPKNKPKRF